MQQITQEFFDQEKWNKIKEKVSQLPYANRDKELQIMEDQQIAVYDNLMQLIKVMKTIVQTDSQEKPENYKFFIEKLPIMIKDILTRKNYEFSEVFDKVDKIVKSYVEFLAITINMDNLGFAESFKTVFEPSKAFYKLNNIDENGILPFGYDTEDSQERKQWLQSLEVDNMIDAVKINKDYSKSCWSRAKIIEKKEEYGNVTIKISFLCEENIYDREILLVSSRRHQIAPYQSMTPDFEQRMNLQQGDIIDVCDPQHVWYNATVKSVRNEIIETGEIKLVEIGYRVYREDGHRKDPENGQMFQGWSAKYDEELCVTSPRIQLKNVMAKKFYLKASTNKCESFVDDSQDIIYNEDYKKKKFFALPRPKICKSTSFLNYINAFGYAGGFENIKNRIANKEKWLDIELLTNYMVGLGSISGMLARQYCFEFVPGFYPVVIQNILQSPDHNIRNMNFEKLQGIKVNLGDIIKRGHYSIGEKREIMEKFQLELSILCFKSSFMQQSVNGLKMINELVDKVANKSDDIVYLTDEIVVNWLTENKIFEIVFNKDTAHAQLIQRSVSFLKFLLKQGIVTDKQIEQLWNLLEKSTLKDLQQQLFLVLEGVSQDFKNEHVEILIRKISEVKPEKLTKEHIDIVYEISKEQDKESIAKQQTYSFLWHLICEEGTHISESVLDSAINKFGFLASKIENQQQKYGYLKDSIHNISKHKSVNVSIRLFKQIIDSFPTQQKFDCDSQGFALKKLINEDDLINVIVENMKLVKKTFKQNKSPSENDVQFYIERIQRRIQFIKYIYQKLDKADQNMSYSFLQSLWQMMVIDAVNNAEKDICYQWFISLDKVRHISIITLLFKEVMFKQQDTEYLQNLSELGFYCFKSIFLSVNLDLKNIIEVKFANKEIKTNAQGVVTSISSTNVNCQEQAEIDFQYQLNNDKSTLIGIDILWYLIFHSKNEKVLSKSGELITKLFTNLSPLIEENTKNIRQEFINTVYQQLIKLNLNQEDKTQLELYLNTTLNILKQFISESEKGGTGGLISHSGIVKGDLVTIKVKNEITVLGNQIKEFELKVNSNITFLELRKMICQKIKVGWKEAKIKRSSNLDSSDMCNGKTLSDIRIKQNETFTILRKYITQPQRVPLVDANKQLLPKPKKIFTSWFEQFSVNGKMDKTMCAKFITSCIFNIVGPEDSQVENIFKDNDLDKDGFLTLEDFLRLYTNFINQDKSETINKLETVWQNLKNKNYREDLKHISELIDIDQDIEQMPRYMLIQQHGIYEFLFQALESIKDKKTSLAIWEFLNYLPTDSQLVEKVKQFQGIKNQQDPNWDLIFNQNSNYKLLYTLQILEFLMQDKQEDYSNTEKDSMQIEETENNNNFQPDEILQKEKQLQNKIEIENEDQKENKIKKFVPVQKDPQWRQEFILYGGFEQLFQVFTKVFQKNLSELDMLDKNILSFIFRIMKNYLIAALDAYVPHIYNITMYTQQPTYSLDEIEQHMSDLEKEYQQKLLGITDQQQQQEQQEIQQKENLYQYKKPKIKESQEFQQLAAVLKGELGNKIIQTLDLTKLRKELTQVLMNFLKQVQENYESKPVKNYLFFSNLENDEKAIIEDTMGILISLLLHSEQCLNEFIGQDQELSKQFIFLGLFFKVHASVRKIFAKFIFLLARQKKGNFLQWIMQILIDNVPTAKDDLRSECTQYYDILCKLIEQGNNNEKFNFSTLQQSLIESIVHYKSEEKRTRIKKDNILSGFLNLCEILFRIEPNLAKNQSEFLFYIFDNLLFAKNPQQYVEQIQPIIDVTDNADREDNGYVKCKHKDSRTIAYKIFNHLVKQNQQILPKLFQEYFYPLIQTIPEQRGWNYLASKHVKSPSGYLGIKNLSNICYMNAMMQQFYMTPAFRYGVMAINDNKEENIVEYQGRSEFNGNKLDDNIIHQMQRLFSYLELSDRADYNPYQFCYSFKDYEGKPVNVGVQQDAQEFLNQIFDKLDDGLKNNPWNYLLQGVYAGKLSSQLVCQGCNNIKENIENFYNLSLTVKNMNSLQESLKHMIEGEVINDYYCEKCEKKQDTTKRVLLNSLPNVLIIHLQRIVFDLDTLMNQKISQKLEFPQILDLQPYTQQQILKDEELKKSQLNANQSENLRKLDKLTLQTQSSNNQQGMVGSQNKVEDDEEQMAIENQNSQIKEQESLKLQQLASTLEEENQKQQKILSEQDDEYQYNLKGVVVHSGGADYGHYYSYIKVNDQENRWKEFNDSIIRDFQVKDLEKECFGGVQGAEKDDFQQLNKQEQSKNAYMLVYEKIKKKPIEFIFDDEKQRDEVLTSLQADKEKYQEELIQVKKQDQNNNNQNDSEELEIQENKMQNKYQVKLEYESIKKLVPKKLYQDVWIDNHKFMLEKQTYCDEYFEFLINFSKSIDYPQDFKIQERQTFDSYIPQSYKNYNQIPQDIQQNYINLLELLHTQTFTHLIRANDNKSIKDIVCIIRDLVDLVPTYAWTYFQNRYINDIKHIFENIILKSPDIQVRSQYCKIILYLINTIVTNYNLTLNPNSLNDKTAQNYEQENTIQELLQYILSLLKDKAASAWVNERNSQYQELIKNFVMSGPVQLRWAFDQQLIGRFCDYFLGQNSNIQEFGETKHQMGNEHAKASFTHCIETIAYMSFNAFNVVDSFQKTEEICIKKQIDYDSMHKYTLSDIDKKGLSNIYLYEKCLLEDLCPDQSGMLITHQCYENKELSQKIAYMLLPSYNKHGVDSLCTTLSYIGYYMMTNDNFIQMRFELLFGYPELKRVNDTSIHFAISGSLYDQTVDYVSSMSDEQFYTHEVISYNQQKKSLLNLMYSTSKNYTNLTILTLRYILEVMKSNISFLQMFILLPPPSPLYSKYLDWIKPFILNYQDEAQKEVNNGGQSGAITMNKLETANKCIELYKFVEQYDNQFLSNLNQDMNQHNLDAENSYLNFAYPNFIVGKTVDIIQQENVQIFENNGKFAYKIVKDYKVNLLESKPNPLKQTNYSLPQQFIDPVKKTLNFNNIKKTSNILNLFDNDSDNKNDQQPPNIDILVNKLNDNNNNDKNDQKIEEEKTNNNNNQNSNDNNKNLNDNNNNGVQNSNNNQAIALQDMQQNQEEVILNNIFTETYIRVVQIKNETDIKLDITSQIIVENNDNCNITCPKTEVYRIINPNSIQSILTFNKMIPNQDFGDYQTLINVKSLNENINNNNEIENDEAQQMKQQQIDAVGPYSVVPVGPVNKDQAIPIDDGQLYMVNCPVCTYENYGGTHCEMCNSPLN